MYHYTESGLRNIWLANGYKEIDTPYGQAVSVKNVDGLHKAIGRHLLGKKKLTGAELRFLRKELGFSQTVMGQAISVSDQTIAQWEKKGNQPKTAELVIRMLYQESCLKENPLVKDLLREINELDRKIHENQESLQFKVKGDTWVFKAQAA